MPPLAVPSSLVSTMPVTPSACVELLRLRERVLALARVEHQQHLVRRRRVEAAEHALHLLQLLHQVALRVQATRGVGDQHVGAARLRGLHRVEDDGGGVGARGLRDHRHAVALAPDLQLLDRGRAERVARREHDLAALVA